MPNTTTSQGLHHLVGRFVRGSTENQAKMIFSEPFYSDKPFELELDGSAFTGGTRPTIGLDRIEARHPDVFTDNDDYLVSLLGRVGAGGAAVWKGDVWLVGAGAVTGDVGWKDLASEVSSLVPSIPLASIYGDGRSGDLTFQKIRISSPSKQSAYRGGTAILNVSANLPDASTYAWRLTFSLYRRPAGSVTLSQFVPVRDHLWSGYFPTTKDRDGVEPYQFDMPRAYDSPASFQRLAMLLWDLAGVNLMRAASAPSDFVWSDWRLDTLRLGDRLGIPGGWWWSSAPNQGGVNPGDFTLGGRTFHFSRVSVVHTEDGGSAQIDLTDVAGVLSVAHLPDESRYAFVLYVESSLDENVNNTLYLDLARDPTEPYLFIGDDADAFSGWMNETFRDYRSLMRGTAATNLMRGASAPADFTWSDWRLGTLRLGDSTLFGNAAWQSDTGGGVNPTPLTAGGAMRGWAFIRVLETSGGSKRVVFNITGGDIPNENQYAWVLYVESLTDASVNRTLWVDAGEDTDEPYVFENADTGAFWDWMDTNIGQTEVKYRIALVPKATYGNLESVTEAQASAAPSDFTWADFRLGTLRLDFSMTADGYQEWRAQTGGGVLPEDITVGSQTLGVEALEAVVDAQGRRGIRLGLDAAIASASDYGLILYVASTSEPGVNRTIYLDFGEADASTAQGVTSYLWRNDLGSVVVDVHGFHGWMMGNLSGQDAAYRIALVRKADYPPPAQAKYRIGLVRKADYPSLESVVASDVVPPLDFASDPAYFPYSHLHETTGDMIVRLEMELLRQWSRVKTFALTSSVESFYESYDPKSTEGYYYRLTFNSAGANIARNVAVDYKMVK